MARQYATYSRVLRWALGALDAGLSLMPRRRPSNALQPAHGSLERILVCDQGHLGDAILATAVLPHLHQRFPGAEIDVLVHPASVPVFESSPWVSRIHTVEHGHLSRHPVSWPRRLLQHWRSQRAALRALRSADYRVAIDLRPFFPNSIPLLHRARIPTTVGWTSAGFGAWLTHGVDDDGQVVNVLQRHRRLLESWIGPTSAGPFQPRLHLTAEAAATWVRRRAASAVPDGYVAVHVGAHSPQRRWSAAPWAALVAQLQQQGRAVVLLGHGPAECATCEDIARACPGAFDLSGKLSWQELVAAIAGSELLVSHDSAAAHIGAATDRPRVCIASGIHDLGMWLQQDARSVVHMHPVPCAPCGRVAGCRTMACLRGVQPEQVAESAASLRRVAAGR